MKCRNKIELPRKLNAKVIGIIEMKKWRNKERIKKKIINEKERKKKRKKERNDR